MRPGEAKDHLREPEQGVGKAGVVRVLVCAAQRLLDRHLRLLAVAEGEVEAGQVEVRPLRQRARAALLAGPRAASLGAGGSGGDAVEVPVEGLERRLEGALLREEQQLQVVRLVGVRSGPG